MKRVCVLAVAVITMPLLLIGQQHFSWIENTGNNATVAVRLSTEISVNGSGLQPGDEIGVFTPDGLCVGGIVWEGDKNQPLTVWGNNALTPDIKDGIDVGETMYYRVWLQQDNTEHTIVDVEYESGSGVYKVDGLYVLNSMTAVPVPDIPELVNPENESDGIAPEVSFQWNTSSWAELYIFQVASDNSFDTIVTERELEQTETVVGLDYGTTYYWRVRAVNIAGYSEWTEIWRFTTETEVVSIEISLQEGWNMISTNIHPEVTDIPILFYDVDDPELFIKNNAGNAYWPALEIYGLTDWNVHEGYQVHVSQQHLLSMYGTKIDPEVTPIDLSEGWNMIPYFLDTALPVTGALQSIEDKIVVIKDINGNIYWPQYEINTIGDMQSGQGYQLYLSADAELTYPAAAEESVSYGYKVQSIVNTDTQPSRYTPDFEHTGSNAIVFVQCPGLGDMDEIGVWTSSGQLAGSGFVNNGRAIITVWGNNVATPDVIDGVVEGEELHLTVWSYTQDMEHDLTLQNVINVLDPNKQSESLTFMANGLYVASVDLPTQVDQEMVPAHYSLAQNYPNPFNPTTQIQFGIKNEEHVLLTVYSVSGQKIAVLLDEQRPAGIYSVDFNAAGLSSGIYYYRLSAGSFQETRRMVLVR